VWTNNVLLDARLVRADGLGLRFDERFGISGGEDTVFAHDIRQAGARIVWTNLAIVTETVTPDRATMRWLLSRAFSGAQRDMAVISRVEGENSRALKRWRFKVARNAITGALGLLAAPAAILLGQDRFMRTVLSGGRKVAKAAGLIAAMCGRASRQYQNTTGC
jgi:succinoglycan biosynthesis protein ExoM